MAGADLLFAGIDDCGLDRCWVLYLGNDICSVVVSVLDTGSAHRAMALAFDTFKMGAAGVDRKNILWALPVALSNHPRIIGLSGQWAQFVIRVFGSECGHGHFVLPVSGAATVEDPR